ncbi:MAG: GNAT family N-acetyltransferase [Rhizobiaceae bacterium]|nr:GNAT family N-acetyltransferase [Rhizobiaceae bacterium]
MSDIEISFDPGRIDFRRTSDLLMGAYWGVARTDEINRRAFDLSLCAGAYREGRQVGFGRAITDRCVYAYLCDVIVWPEERGRGIGQALVRAFLDHPELAEVRHWNLTTQDAHGLYERFGFRRSTDGRYMRFDRG